MADRYLSFDRDEWADLRAATPLTLRQEDLDSLWGINERIDLDEVDEPRRGRVRAAPLAVGRGLQRAHGASVGSRL